MDSAKQLQQIEMVQQQRGQQTRRNSEPQQAQQREQQNRRQSETLLLQQREPQHQELQQREPQQQELQQQELQQQEPQQWELQQWEQQSKKEEQQLRQREQPKNKNKNHQQQRQHQKQQQRPQQQEEKKKKERTSAPSIIFQVLILLFCLAAVGIACAEIAAASLGFKACPSVARHLLATGLAALVGCAPMAATKVVVVLRIGNFANSRSHRARLRQELADADGFVETPHQSEDGSTASWKSAGSSESSKYADDNSPSSLDPDIHNWVSGQVDSSDLQLIKSDAGDAPGNSGLHILRRFIGGIYSFYRPDVQQDEPEQRQIIAMLLGLPISCAYALPLYKLLFSQQWEALPAGCEDAHPLLRKLGRPAVWLRAAVAGAALLACLVASAVDLVRRRRVRNRITERLGQERSQRQERMFG